MPHEGITGCRKDDESSYTIPALLTHFPKPRCKTAFWIVRLYLSDELYLISSALGLETAGFPGQSNKEIERLLHSHVIS
jgi:hypothetical protein